MVTSVMGWLVRCMARVLVRFYYPQVEVRGAERLPREGGVLLVANHPNSLFDPVMLELVARRPVSLLAKAPLFEVPVFGRLLRALGMVPAYRGADDARKVEKNRESLGLAAAKLGGGDWVGIFPEGKSHDAPQVARARSGAARLAIQAVEGGGVDVWVVPVGILYESKERFRSSVLIEVGEPILAGAWLAGEAGDGHRAMRTLTQEIDRRLRGVALHLDEAGWEGLAEDLRLLLPAAGFGRGEGLAVLGQRKRAAEAINYFFKTDPERAGEAAARARGHAAALRAEGMGGDAGGVGWSGGRRLVVMVKEAVGLWFGVWFGLCGAMVHALPHGLTRLIAGRLQGKGKVTVALTRLGVGMPIYAVWYAGVGWWLAGVFMPWVVVGLMGLLPFSGLSALRLGRRCRVLGPKWWAGMRLMMRPGRRVGLEEEQAGVKAMLEEMAAEFERVKPREEGKEAGGASWVLVPPRWLNLVGLGVAVGLGAVVVWGLVQDRPVDLLRDRGPVLGQMEAEKLEARLKGDERGLVAMVAGLGELEGRFRRFETGLLDGGRSYYLQNDDDEIRRMLTTFLAYRDGLLRLTWGYQRHGELEDEDARLRAMLVHYAAAAVLHDYAVRFVAAFDGRERAVRKINEAEPRWDLAAGTFEEIRAGVANRGLRRWLVRAWDEYQATLPAWVERGLWEEEPWRTMHAAIEMAALSTADLGERRGRYKVDGAGATVRGWWESNFYRVSAVISTLVGDARVRAPRGGEGLVDPGLLERLRPMLQPGDILIERRNWYVSNAFLPGFWPHAALYVGTPEELEVLGVVDDPRVRAHWERFTQADERGRRRAVIEAVSEGVIFTSLERSAGEADAVAVLRPRLSVEDRREVVARAFSHAGKPYDFDFDFFSADKLVCTEVVYRALGGRVDFPLVTILGRRTLPALEMVRYWTTEEGGEKLEFVAFIDGDDRRGKSWWGDEAGLRGTLERSALTWRD